MVKAWVASTGEVCRVEVAHSSGHVALDRAAVKAVARWKFRPATIAGVAMASEVTVPIRFQLRQEQAATLPNP